MGIINMNYGMVINTMDLPDNLPSGIEFIPLNEKRDIFNNSFNEITNQDKVQIVCTWEYDNWHQSKSWVEYGNIESGNIIKLYSNQKECLAIYADRDLWGTWITFKINNVGFTIAQEDGTKSFVDALISALTKLKNITDIDTKAPNHVYLVCDHCDGHGSINNDGLFIDCPKCKK